MLGAIHHIEYYVNDLRASRAFWDWFAPEVGFTEISDFGDGVSYIHPQTDTYLVFVQVVDEYLEAGNTRQGNGLNHLALRGASLAELDRVQAKLEANSIKILKRKGDYLCFEDPNAFAIEIYATDVA